MMTTVGESQAVQALKYLTLPILSLAAMVSGIGMMQLGRGAVSLAGRVTAISGALLLPFSAVPAIIGMNKDKQA